MSMVHPMVLFMAEDSSTGKLMKSFLFISLNYLDNFAVIHFCFLTFPDVYPL